MWIDVTVTITEQMPVWPGQPAVQLEKTASMENGDVANVTALHLSAHTGTHMDAPLHFVKGGKSIDEIPLESVIGKARVIAINNPEYITVEELQAHQIQPEERLIFKTKSSAEPWYEQDFKEKYVHFTTEAAELLAQKRTKCVGIDYLSVSGFHTDGVDVHQALLGADVWIIEGLKLKDITPGAYEMIALPLKIAGADGSPARVLLRKL